MNDSVISSCFEASLQGQAIVSETGAFLLVNTAFCQHFGYSKEEMYERPIESFFICEDHATKENHSDFLFKKGQKYEQVEKVILHGNGYLQSTLFTITDVSSSEETCFHLQLDRVTVNLQQDGDQKMLLESIRNRDEVRLPKKILDGIKDAIITIKLNGQFLYVNEEAEKMLALTWNDLQQSDFWSYLMKDRNETLTKKFYHLLVGEDYAQVEYFDKKHSKWFDVRAYRSEDQVTMYFINVTERKQMEEELRLKEENYRSLVENIPETITVHDGNEFIYINPAGESLFGVTNADRLSETKLNQLLSTYDMAKVREGIRQLLSGDIAVDHSLYTLLLQNGKTIEVEATTTVIQFRGKHAFRTIIKDISERKKMDDLIRKSDKLAVVAQLAAGVAHEIRNPLTTIKGFLQVFQKEEKYNSFYLNLVMEELERVESIIYEYLTLAKPNFENKFQKIDMVHLVNQLITLTEAQSNMNNVKLDFEYEQVPMIYGLEKQLKQVLINLIRNSIEAIAEKGVITVRIANHPHNQICIQVEDNGCGIPKERIERLGEPFYSTKEKGTGLGLMVCYKIIEHHNGVFNIYSKEGFGTKMEIILPTSVAMETNEALPQ